MAAKISGSTVDQKNDIHATIISEYFWRLGSMKVH